MWVQVPELQAASLSPQHVHYHSLPQCVIYTIFTSLRRVAKAGHVLTGSRAAFLARGTLRRFAVS